MKKSAPSAAVATYRMIEGGAVVRVDDGTPGPALSSASHSVFGVITRSRSSGIGRKTNNNAAQLTVIAADITQQRRDPPRPASKSPPATRRRVTVDRAAKARYVDAPQPNAVLAAILEAPRAMARATPRETHTVVAIPILSPPPSRRPVVVVTIDYEVLMRGLEILEPRSRLQITSEEALASIQIAADVEAAATLQVFQRNVAHMGLQEKYSRAFLLDEESEFREVNFILVFKSMQTQPVVGEESRRRGLIVKDEAAMFRLVMSARAQRAQRLSSALLPHRDYEYDAITQSVQLALEIAWNVPPDDHSPSPIPLLASDRDVFLQTFATRSAERQSLYQPNAQTPPDPGMLFDCILSGVVEFCEFVRPHAPSEHVAVMLRVTSGRKDLTRRQTFTQCERFVIKKLRNQVDRSRQPQGYHMVTATQEVCEETTAAWAHEGEVLAAAQTLMLERLVVLVLMDSCWEGKGGLDGIC